MKSALQFLISLGCLFLGVELNAQRAIKFIPWEDPGGLFKAEVPDGWSITANIDPNNIAMGAFLIQGSSPDQQSIITFAHNWSCYYEYYYGHYRPGNSTLETIVLPGIPDALPQFQIGNIMVTYRSGNQSFTITNPYTGMPIRGDHGTLGVYGISKGGNPIAGSLSAETMFVPVSGTPGYWCLRIFMGEMSFEGAYREYNKAVLQHFIETFEPSPRFIDAWNQGFEQTVASMRQYSAQVDRITRDYIRRPNDPASKKSVFDNYSEMTRGGHYEKHPGTGEDYYVSNDYNHHWVEPNGTIHSNNTGTMPQGYVGLTKLQR